MISLTAVGSAGSAGDCYAKDNYHLASELEHGSQWLTHHVSILTMNGDSYRLKESAGGRRAAAAQAGAVQNPATAVDPDTGKITQA